MQRTLQSTPLAVLTSSPFESARQHSLQFPPALRCGEASAPLCLFSPIHYEAGYQYPLVVWLHGPQSSELELQQVMPLVSVRNYVGVAPRGTRRASSEKRLFGWDGSKAAVADATERVLDCVRIASRRFNVHRDRIFLVGYGEGGTMALRVGLDNPDLFAGVCSLAGPVPRGGNAFRNLRAARRLPLMVSVSPIEGEYGEQQVLEDVRLLHSGGFKLSLQLYPGGASLTQTMLSDLDVWLMSQFCPAASAAG
jgi:phospholipase/carboxylesterase